MQKSKRRAVTEQQQQLLLSTKQVDAFVDKLNRYSKDDPAIIVLDSSFYERLVMNLGKGQPEQWWRTKWFQQPLFKSRNWDEAERIVVPINRPLGVHWLLVTLIPRDLVAILTDSNALDRTANEGMRFSFGKSIPTVFFLVVEKKQSRFRL